MEIGRTGSPLSDRDFAFLNERWITSELAEHAGIRRVDSDTGRTLIGAGSGDYAGLIIPYTMPGGTTIREIRLRRDNPECELTSVGSLKPRRKYLSPPGRQNMLYFAPGTTGLSLTDVSLPIVINEGEFKTLALSRLATYSTVSPRFCPVGVSGVWNWRGTIGKMGGPNGERLCQKGCIPDLDRIEWRNRKVAIAFDADADVNESVRLAKLSLAKELRRRGAHVGFLEWPIEKGKGIDDYLHNHGPDGILALWVEIKYRDSQGWRESLSRGKGGGAKPNLCNACVALKEAPEWEGVLQFNEFNNRVETIKRTPWNYAGVWNDDQTSRLTVWLQQHGIDVNPRIAHDAVTLVAKDYTIHPVRAYLESLIWDGTPRLNKWLTLYLGVAESRYTSLVGQRWLVSAVARILNPGCKADVAMVLEGAQGIGKSRALGLLSGSWFTDYLPDLHSKDAAIQLSGVWIIEVAELDALSRVDATTIKAFLSRSVDKFRPPYARITQDVPRQCVFAGTTNSECWLSDESGGRRFWPVRCGILDLGGLAAVRDQLFAEAVEQYNAKGIWWADTELSVLAEEQMADRLESDPWMESISEWTSLPRTSNGEVLLSTPSAIHISEVLQHAIGKPKGQWFLPDTKRVASCLRILGFTKKRRPCHGGATRLWVYVRDPKRV